MWDGVGTDIVAVQRITALLEEHGTAFLHRWFTPGEIAYCSAKAHPGRHYAARMAAKEAVVKALPFPWEGPVPWRWVEVVHDRRGAPQVRLSGPLLAAAERSGVREIRVSLSHCDDYATAVVLLALTPGDRPDAGCPPQETRPAVPPQAVDRERVERLLQEWAALRDPDLDPDLEALRGAILLEDAFGVTFRDEELDLALLSDPDTLVDLLGRRRERR